MSAEDVWRDLGILMFEVADPHGSVIAATGLSFFKCKVLRRLQSGPVSAGALAKRLASDPAYVSITLRELESGGLVFRTEDATDRRRRLVELTDEGREMAIRADRALATPPPSFATLSDEDLAHLSRLVTALLP